MTRIDRRMLLRGAGAALAAAPLVVRATPASAVPEPAAELDRRLRALADRDLFAGAMLVGEGDRPVFTGAYGPASREYDRPNTPETRFNLASASKMFTAVAVAQLAEAGRLGLDDTIDRFVDDTWLAPEHAARIRIGHLLCHTSGLGSYFGPQFAQASRLAYRNLADFKGLVRGDAPMFEPGSTWSYSNNGYLLLGVIVERASGMGFDDYVAERITRPLGMAGTAALDLDRVNTGYAQNYHKVPLGAPPPSPPPAPPPGRPLPFIPFGERARQVRAMEEKLVRDGFAWRNNVFEHVVKGGPAGAWYASAGDMFRFLRGFARGELVSERTRALMTTPKPNAPNWGYGFILDGGGYGHTGGFLGVSAYVGADASGRSVVILANISGGALIALDETAPLIGR